MYVAVSVIKPSAFAVNFTKLKSVGKTIGKLKIAIKVALLFAFEEIAETKVKVMPKPMLPSSKANQNCPCNRTGFSVTKLNKAYVKALINSNKHML